MTTKYNTKTTSEDGHELVIDVDSRIGIPVEIEEGFKELFDEFVAYKTESADLGNIPCPSEETQKEYLSITDVFGKDKQNHFPKPDAKRENLHHVHVFDGETDEDLAKWNAKQQIRRSCDTLLFYSYFEHNEIHYFYVLQFILDPEGHDFQKDNAEMKALIDYAEEYRLSIIKA